MTARPYTSDNVNASSRSLHHITEASRHRPDEEFIKRWLNIGLYLSPYWYFYDKFSDNISVSSILSIINVQGHISSGENFNTIVVQFYWHLCDFVNWVYTNMIRAFSTWEIPNFLISSVRFTHTPTDCVVRLFCFWTWIRIQNPQSLCFMWPSDRCPTVHVLLPDWREEVNGQRALNKNAKHPVHTYL